jgi:hypothetical protein
MPTRKTRLDPDTVVALCEQFSGYDGVVSYLAEKGLKNPDTGKPFTKHAIIYAAKKSDKWKAWHNARQKERTDTANEFNRIAKKRLATIGPDGFKEIAKKRLATMRKAAAGK